MAEIDWEHAIAVAGHFVDDWDAKAYTVALLHDAIEDGVTTLQGLRDSGVAEDEANALDAITRRKGERYTDYIERVAQNSLARRVKLADLEENLKRMDADHESLRKRYERARERLSDRSQP